MKKLITTSILALLIASVTTVRAQDMPEEYLGLPGDNLNLYAVMNLFQESETLEGFEKRLNDENSRINNLDLNGDNLIDYITVNDYVDGNVHTIVLRAALNPKEAQDVAVFTVEKLRNGEVVIQLIGDEALYGRNYIVEPIYAETPNPGYRGKQVNRSNVTVVTTTYYEVASWPLITFMYHPHYVVWRSSWYWGYYPHYWNPWRPYYWHYYYGYHYHWHNHYYSHYHHWDHPRYNRYNDFYYRNVRTYSSHVNSRIREGSYRSTYSRPETRREGEELYTKTYGSTDRRSSVSTGSNAQGRRTVSTSSGERASSGTNADNTRRTSTSATTRPANSPSSERSSSTVRRSTSTVSEKTATRPSSGQNSQYSGRTQGTSSERTVSKPSSSQTTESARRTTSASSQRTVSQKSEQTQRSSGTVSQRPASRTESSTRTQSSRSSSSRPTEARSGSSSQKSSSGTGKSSSSTRSSSSSKSSSSKSSGDKESSGSRSRR